MRKLLKENWIDYCFMLFALVVAFSLVGTEATVEPPEWYRGAATLGVTFAVFGSLVTVRLVWMIVSHIVRNARAAGKQVP